MAVKGSKMGPDGKYYFPEGVVEKTQAKEEPMQEEKIYAPHVVNRNVSSERKYYFENKGQPGHKEEFFAGNAPVKGKAPSANDVKKYSLQHGTTVMLTEEMARHVKSKGILKPITEKDNHGRVRMTDETYLDRRFDLHEA